MTKKKETKINPLSLKWPLLNKQSTKIGIILSGAIIFLAAGVLIFNLSYSNKIFPKTIIGGIDLGGMSQTQAEAALDKAIQTKNDQKLTLTFKDKRVELSRESLQVKYDLKASANLAWEVGRKGSFSKVLKEQSRSIFSLNNTNNLVFSYENSNLDKVFSDLLQSLANPLKETTIVIKDLVPSIQAGQAGESVDENGATKIVLDFFGQLQSSKESSITAIQASARVSTEEAEKTLKTVEAILKSEYKLKDLDHDFVLKPEEISSWLEFTPTKNFWANWSLAINLNDKKLSSYVTWLAEQIDRDPKNAKFNIDNGKVTAFELSQTGQKLDQTKTKDILSKAIVEQTVSIKLPVGTVEPTVSSGSIDSHDFKELVGEGKTSWRGSPANRIHNLTLGSEKISGSVVMPGEEFSTVKAISPITAEAGFKPELVIKNSNQVEPEIGGGLCQVSTTLFRAVLNTGLKVTQRTNHSFRVSYYEPPVGMDATIYDPKPDFKFVNNMKTPILIWAIPTDNGLTFQMFGTKDKRKVEISDPVLFNYVSPGSPIYTVKESMGPEDIRQVERATRGVTASFTYKVTSAAGEVLEDDKFVSKYVPIADTFFVGPGYQIPAPPAE